MGSENKLVADRLSADYLTQLLQDKKYIQAFPNLFTHIGRLLDEEINRVRIGLFHSKNNSKPLSLPDPIGPPVALSEKVWVPTDQYPEFNFVGRILGPRGMTLKDLEAQTSCKILVRGKGSLRDKQKEEANRGKTNWEHLNESLHVLITVEDSRNRAEIKLQTAIKEIKKLLIPADEGEDDIKKNQLMELAIFNGTYRTNREVTPPTTNQILQAPRLVAPSPLAFQQMPSPAGAPIILAPRMPLTHLNGSILSAAPPPPLVSPTDATTILYNPYDLPYSAAALSPTLFEYQPQLDASSSGGPLPKFRRSLSNIREHPYTRVMNLPTATQ